MTGSAISPRRGRTPMRGHAPGGVTLRKTIWSLWIFGFLLWSLCIFAQSVTTRGRGGGLAKTSSRTKWPHTPEGDEGPAPPASQSLGFRRSDTPPSESMIGAPAVCCVARSPGPSRPYSAWLLLSSSTPQPANADVWLSRSVAEPSAPPPPCPQPSHGTTSGPPPNIPCSPTTTVFIPLQARKALKQEWPPLTTS